MGEYYDWYDKNPEESKSLTVQFTKLTKIRQVIADEKISQTIELAENIVEQGKKVIIFCNFTDSLNKICEHFGKAAVKVDGSMSKPERQPSVDSFQENDKIKVNHAYFQKLLDMSRTDLNNRNFIQGVINSIRKSGGMATQRQYAVLKRFESGDKTPYSSKN
jgi:ERCC4-related helicase